MPTITGTAAKKWTPPSAWEHADPGKEMYKLTETKQNLKKNTEKILNQNASPICHLDRTNTSPSGMWHLNTNLLYKKSGLTLTGDRIKCHKWQLVHLRSEMDKSQTLQGPKRRKAKSSAVYLSLGLTAGIEFSLGLNVAELKRHGT
jgi:hypothetical protein